MQNEFMKWFGLSVPVLQAPIGSATSVGLVRAVGEAGGMGSMAMTWTGEIEAKKQVEELRATGLPFFVNFVLHFGTKKPYAVLGTGIPAVTLSWGLDPKLIAHARSLGIKTGVQAGTAQGARRAVQSGADFVILQGVEAGGHVQSTTPLDHLLHQATNLHLGVPLVVAGGLATGKDIARCLKAGAAAVMLGTRFMASEESLAHAAYKQAIVAAAARDTVFTNCFDIDWPYAMHRVLRNSTLDSWEAAGSPAAPSRPGEGDIIGTQGGSNIIRYSDAHPTADAEGDVLAACLYAGTGVEHIDSVLPAAEIVTTLWQDTLRHLR